MKKLLTVLFTLAAITAFSQKISLDKGWHFNLGDIPFPAITGHGVSYENAKAGKAWGAAAPEYDDTNWPVVNLPHDWSVEQPYDSTENISQGYRKRGFGWYRRSFKVDPKDRGKSFELQFDGIATHATIWFNGTIVHRNFCGYTSSYIDITPFLRYGDDVNKIAIRVDANQQEGWWYEGAGLYRHAWLVKRNPIHFITDGVFANPIKIATGKWLIPVEATITNDLKQTGNVTVETALYDAAGKLIIQQTANTIVNPLHQSIVKLNLNVDHPKLWFTDNPVLYSVKTIVKKDNQILDEKSVNCGFRTIKFTADSGFYLNDVWMKIKGTCNHQDHAGVGVAVPDALWEYRIRKLKEMGSNAYRCAHNPPAAEFLDACDRLGLMVMDENRNFNSSDEYQRQLEWMIRRDRNHPSIILWSVFNEEPMQGSEIGYEMVRRMSAIVKNFDTTRPITAAMNGGQFTPLNVSHAVDVVGFNYDFKNYDRFHQMYPNVPMTSSEDVSCVMQRGVYVTDKKQHLLASYDEEKPSWGTTHRVGWKAVAERPFMAGCFIWTGFDYRGEPTPYDWPTAASNFGIMDACGFPKMAFYLHQAQWINSRPILQLVPHWNWPKDSIGKPIKVMAMSNAEKVKLLLNGKEIGEQTVDKYEMNTWMVPYQPGKLEAIGYVNNKEVSRSVVETTGEAVALQLTADRNYLYNDGADAIPVNVSAIDSKGRVVPVADNMIEFSISDNASMIGVANGDPNSHEAEKGNKRSLYNGWAQLIIQSKEFQTGTITITAKSGNLKAASVTVISKDTVQKQFVDVVQPVYVVSNNWRLSPFYDTKPNIDQEIAGNDMNSWSPVRTGQLQSFTNGNFVVYRNSFKPYAAYRKNGAFMTIKSVNGKAEVWVDKKLVATKTDAQSGDISFELTPSEADRKINIIIESEKGSKAGIGGAVVVTKK